MAWSVRQSLVGGSKRLLYDVPNAGDTNAVGYPLTTLPGSLLVMICWGNVYSPSSNPTPPPSLTPSGTDWILAGTVTGNDGSGHTSERASIYYIPNAASIAPSTTFTLHGSTSKGQIEWSFCLYEFAGVPSACTVQDVQSAHQTTINTVPVTPNLSTHPAGTQAIVVIASTSQALSDHGTTYVAGPHQNYSFSQYALNVSPGSINTSFTMTAGYWAAVAVAFGSPVPSNIVTQKATNPPGSGQPFSFTPSWGAPFTLRDGESNDSGLLDPGTYSIAETPIPGWSPAVTVDGEAKDPSAIVLEAGQTITVLFTNTESHVVVQKASSPAGSSQDFTFHPSWASAPFTLRHGQSNDSGPLAPGPYSITEDAIDGWRQVSSAVDQDGHIVTRGTDGSFTLEAGQTITITYMNITCRCLDFTEMVVRDGNDVDIVVAGGADGNLYLLYDGISDYDGSEIGKFFTAEALALKYVGPQRTVIRDLEWYGDENAEFFFAKQLTTPFDPAKMSAFGPPEEVQDDEGSNHWRATVQETQQTIHAYVLMRLQGRVGGTMELSEPPHMPVESYGRVLLVSRSAAGSNPR